MLLRTSITVSCTGPSTPRSAHVPDTSAAVYPTFPYSKSLHYSASSTSLSSIASNYSGLYVNCPPDTAIGLDAADYTSRHSSRQSSISSVAGLDKISPLAQSWNGFSPDTHSYGRGVTPKLHVHTQSLGRMSRMRSASRIGPYDRLERSESVSER
jgi:hypothetical protein